MSDNGSSPQFSQDRIEAQKRSLREQALLRRQSLTEEERLRASFRVAKRLLEESLIPEGSIVAGYWPVRGELDIIPAMKELMKWGHRVCLPQIVEKGQPLMFREWREEMPMIEGALGIAVPDPAVADIRVPDVLLVPLVGFDAGGHRLGYGGGYYDRTIAQLRRANVVQSIGIGFEIQKCEALPTGAHDRKMDVILTENGVYRYS